MVGTLGIKIKNLFGDSTFKRLYKHTVNYGAGSALTQVIGFLLIPLYTIYLTPEDYGLVELVSTITAFAVPLMKLGVPGSVTRFYFDYKHDPEKLTDYYTTVNKLLNLSAIIIGGILLLILYFGGELLYPGLAFFPFMVISIITAGMGANNQLQQRIIQIREQSKYSMYLKTSFTLFSILTAIVFIVYFRMGAMGMVLASFITAILFFFQALYYLKPFLKGKYNPQMAKESLKYGVGILPHHLAASAAPLINKTLLLNLGSLSSLGLFSLGARFFLPLELIYTSINTAFIPIYNDYRANNEVEKVRKTVKQILLASFLAFAGFQLISCTLLVHILPSNFHPSIPLIPILSVAFIGKTIYNISVVEIFYSKKTKFISIITLTSLAINVLVCLLFVKGYGSLAVSWAFSISFLAWGVLSSVYKRKVSDFTMFYKELTAFTAACFAVFLLFRLIA